MKPTKLHKGQKIVCTHYKDHPVVKVDYIIEKSRHISGYDGPEIWVYETKKDGSERHWWGPRGWFRALPRKKVRPIRKSHVPRITGLALEGSLCDSGVPGCSCNQSASMVQ